jgi:hypothetical protein
MSFEEGALLAANLGYDADTTAAVFGQLGGAYFGEEGIPARWRSRLALRGTIEELADRLLDASRAGPMLDRNLASPSGDVKARHAGRGLRRLRIGSLAVLASALVLSPLAAGADGDLDPTFGTGGKVVTDLGANEWAAATAIQADGKIVVAGGGSAHPGDFLIVRYRSNPARQDPKCSGSGCVKVGTGPIRPPAPHAPMAEGAAVLRRRQANP